jgi:crotonobetainyl-CoA:carnitine CoA-transferase CaiB-like acyl-CoA transferase
MAAEPTTSPWQAAAGREAAPLKDVKVLEVANLYAGPLCGTILGDFGARVRKLEHPKGDPLRGHGAQKDGHGLWWKQLARNKDCATINLSHERGQELFREQVADADVVIESFRPGVMERWGLGYEELREVNPRLVMVRVTGFGQHGPYSARPGFGTLAEAMSGWAYMNGHPDGPPTLPPFGHADGMAGMSAAIATLIAIREAERSGQGQEVDLAIIEPIMYLLGPQPTLFQQLGVVPERTGNTSPNSAPRNVYRTRDERWVAVASSTNSIAERVMTLIGRADLIEQEWFGSGRGRAAHMEQVDGPVAAWIGEHDAADVIVAFEQVGAAVALVSTIADVYDNPQYRALGSLAAVEDPELGSVVMQNMLFRLSRTPGGIDHAGRPLGADNGAIYGRDEAELARLREEGAI